MTPVQIKNLRKSFDLERASFAALLGCNERTLTRWEDGSNSPQGLHRTLLSWLIRVERETPAIDMKLWGKKCWDLMFDKGHLIALRELLRGPQ